jgi:hypothetical protein
VGAYLIKQCWCIILLLRNKNLLAFLKTDKCEGEKINHKTLEVIHRKKREKPYFGSDSQGEKKKETIF